MKRLLPKIVALFCLSLVSCSPRLIVRIDDIQKVVFKENTVYEIDRPWDLKGRTVAMPKNCTLFFKRKGSISNGIIEGNETKLQYSVPFVGDNISLRGCTIEGRSEIKDSDVFVTVKHCQNEIQTLFDISNGKRIEFTKGVYKDIEKIVINNSVDAHFNNSEIFLRWRSDYLAECFYMEPWKDLDIDYVKINDLKVTGRIDGIANGSISRRCIQLFYVSEVLLNNVTIDKFYGGPQEYDSDTRDLLDKSRIGTCAIAIMKYDKCTINHCRTNDINKEIFWCVPSNNPNNILYFTNNISTHSSELGSSSFLTLLDGRCVVKNNEVYNYNGSALNTFCYDSEIAYNKFYDGKRSIAIDLSEGRMYRTKNVYVHDNYCLNTRGLLAAFGEDIRIKNNKWINQTVRCGERCIVITILTRGQRTAEGKYVGCENNPENHAGSMNIVIESNECVNEVIGKEYEVRFACVYGVNISFSNNHLTNLNVPVVQLVEGTDFVFKSNRLSKSNEGYYAELLINKGKDITINNNSFSRNCITGEMFYTVHVMTGIGRLTYRSNSINIEDTSQNNGRIYVPCYVQDCSNLSQADLFFDRKVNIARVETRLDQPHIRLRTNIKDGFFNK